MSRLCEDLNDNDINRRKEEARKYHKKFEDIPVSGNQIRREKEFRELHKRKANLIDDYENRFIHAVVMMNPKWVCLEKFAKQKLYKNQSWVDPRMNDVHTFAIRQKMERQCKKYNIPYYEVDNIEFPTTDTCSRCGCPHEVYKERVFICPNCGLTMDRDFNAAINIAKYPRMEMIENSKQSMIDLLNTIRPVTANDILGKEYLALRVMAVKVDNSKPR